MTAIPFILVALAAAACGAWIIVSPRRGAFVFGLAIVTNASAVLTRTFDIPPFILPLSLAIVGIAVLRSIRSARPPSAPIGDRSWLPVAVLASIAAVVLSAAIGPFVSVATSSSRLAVSLLIQNLLVVAAAVAVSMRARSFRALLAGMVGGGFALSTITNFQALTGTRDWDAFGFSAWNQEVIGGAGNALRAAGPFIDDPNTYARELVVAIGITLGFLITIASSAPRWRRPLLIAAAVSMTFGVIDTASRSGLIGLAVVGAIALVVQGLNRRQLVIAAAVGLLVILSPVGVGSRLSTLGTTSPSAQEADSGLRGRASEMLAAVDMFTDHPVTGVGYGTYNDRYLDYSRKSGIDQRFELRSAHSLPLEIAAEQGLTGLAAWTSLVGLTFVVVRRLRRRFADLGTAFGLGVVGFASVSVFLHDVHPQLMWTLVGTTLGAAILLERAERRQISWIPGQPLRVAMVIQSYVPAVGGAERQLANLMPSLIEGGIEPLVISRNMPGRPRNDEVDGVPVVRLFVAGPKLLHSLMFVAQARAVLGRFEPHVVHAFDSMTPSSIALGHRAETGTPVATKILRSGELGDLYRLGKKPFGLLRLRRLLRGVDAIVAISADIEQELATQGVPETRVATIPNGVDTKRFKPRRQRTRSALAHDFSVVATGRLAPEKRLVEIASQWHRVTARWPGTRLVLVGDGPEAERLSGLDDVLLLGRRSDVDEIVRKSDIYVSASQAEGLSNSLLEAMSSGLPCVVTDVGGVHDVIQNPSQGIIVPADDLDVLIDELIVLIGDVERRSKMGSAARRQVLASYGLDETARRLIELYTDLARSSGPLGDVTGPRASPTDRHANMARERANA
jgi:glycosyltransferase involved in cell wall biosynthesis/O-antigen ligase